eukprot:647998-Prorocentrum_lima.AAC.1
MAATAPPSPQVEPRTGAMVCTEAATEAATVLARRSSSRVGLGGPAVATARPPHARRVSAGSTSRCHATLSGRALEEKTRPGSPLP